MERHEIKALVDGRMAEGKRSLDAMKARADAATGEADAKYREGVRQLQTEHDEIRARAERVWNASEDEFDSASKDLERYLDAWELRAKQTHKARPM